MSADIMIKKATASMLSLVGIILLCAACGSDAGGGGADADEQLCADMETAATESEGTSCGGGGDCPAIPCACADGSVVETSACFNGSCRGVDACADVCDSVRECDSNNSGNNSTTNNSTTNNSTTNNSTTNNSQVEVGDGSEGSVCEQHSDCDSEFCYISSGEYGECGQNDIGRVCDSPDDCAWRLCYREESGLQYCTVPCPSQTLECPSSAGTTYSCVAEGFQSVCVADDDG
jgi:hypothetical protein